MGSAVRVTLMAPLSFGESVVSFHSNTWSSVSLMVTFWAPVEAASSARAAPPWAVTLVVSPLRAS